MLNHLCLSNANLSLADEHLAKNKRPFPAKRGSGEDASRLSQDRGQHHHNVSGTILRSRASRVIPCACSPTSCPRPANGSSPRTPTVVHQTTANHYAARAECQSRPLWDMLPSSEGHIVRAPVVPLSPPCPIPNPRSHPLPPRLLVYSPGITTFWVLC